MSEIRIKERRAVAHEYSEEVYTPESIREIWSGSTPADCLVLALLEKWEVSESSLEAVTKERDSALRELERWRHGNTVEGDFVCPNELERTAALAEIMRMKPVFDAAVAWRKAYGLAPTWDARRALTDAIDEAIETETETETPP